MSLLWYLNELYDIYRTVQMMPAISVPAVYPFIRFKKLFTEHFRQILCIFKHNEILSDYGFLPFALLQDTSYVFVCMYILLALSVGM